MKIVFLSYILLFIYSIRSDFEILTANLESALKIHLDSISFIQIMVDKKHQTFRFAQIGIFNVVHILILPEDEYFVYKVHH